MLPPLFCLRPNVYFSPQTAFNKNILSIKNLEKLTRFKIQFSLTLYTPPAPCRKGEGRLGQGVHKVLESQSSVCQDRKYGEKDENKVKMKKVF